MVSKARHDLRDPLGHILGFSEMLIEEAQAEGRLQTAADALLLARETLEHRRHA